MRKIFFLIQITLSYFLFSSSVNLSLSSQKNSEEKEDKALHFSDYIKNNKKKIIGGSIAFTIIAKIVYNTFLKKINKNNTDSTNENKIKKAVKKKESNISELIFENETQLASRTTPITKISEKLAYFILRLMSSMALDIEQNINSRLNEVNKNTYSTLEQQANFEEAKTLYNIESLIPIIIKKMKNAKFDNSLFTDIDIERFYKNNCLFINFLLCVELIKETLKIIDSTDTGDKSLEVKINSHSIDTNENLLITLEPIVLYSNSFYASHIRKESQIQEYLLSHFGLDDTIHIGKNTKVETASVGISPKAHKEISKEAFFKEDLLANETMYAQQKSLFEILIKDYDKDPHENNLTTKITQIIQITKKKKVNTNFIYNNTLNINYNYDTTSLNKSMYNVLKKLNKIYRTKPNSNPLFDTPSILTEI